MENKLEQNFMDAQSVGEKYLNFINLFGYSDRDDFSKEIELLFLPDIKKVVNSRTICFNRNDVFSQMVEMKKTYGLKNLNLLELFVSNDGRSNILRWEITYKDNNTESVITILKYNDQGLISEINEVFGEKEVYQWPDK